MDDRARIIVTRCEYRWSASGSARYLRLCRNEATSEVVWFDGVVERRCGTHTQNARLAFPSVVVRPLAPRS